MVKGTRFIPVMCSQITLLASWNTTCSNNDTEQDKANNRNDLNDGEDKFSFTIAANTKEVDGNNKDPKDDDEGCWIDMFCTVPVGYRDGGRSQL